MSNDVTTRQIKKFLELLDEKDMTLVRFQQILSSGVLSDVFDERVGWGMEDRNLIRVGLGLTKDVSFTTWKTIRLGTYLKTADDFRQALKSANFRTGDWANDLLSQKAFTVAAEETDVNLVVMSVADLGFKKGAQYQQICVRAKELGLDLCPAEVGPQLRLQYPDQPKGEWLIVAMEAIRDSRGRLDVFYVGHGGDGQWLGARDSDPDDSWDGGRRFVFLSRK